MAIVVANRIGPLAQWLEQRTQGFERSKWKLHTILKDGLQANHITRSILFSGSLVESVKFGEA